MRVLRLVRDYPAAVLGVAVAALAAWVVVEFSRPGIPAWADQSARADGDAPAVVPVTIHDPNPPGDRLALARPLAGTDEPESGPPPVRVSVLPKLKPGMTRTQVEELLGQPTADRIEPVTAADGRLTYRTAYELAEADAPMTVRPIQPRPRTQAPRDPASVVALEYDASRPGHPLVQVLYPDPLF